MNKDIYNFICSLHKRGRDVFTDEGFSHYMRILDIIRNKMFNPEQPESKFVELCVAGKWDYAKAVADTRNKEAIEYCDMFRRFIEHIRKTSEYIENNRDKQINKIIEC